MATDYTQDANVLGAWLFDEGSGQTLGDASSNNRDGTFKGSGEPAWASASLPAAYSDYYTTFDGSDDFISYTAVADGTLSWCGWVNKRTGGEQQIMTNSSTNASWRIGVSSGDDYQFTKGGVVDIPSIVEAPYQSWQFICYTYNDSSGDWIFYYNGSADDSGNNTQNFSAGDGGADFGSSPFGFGATWQTEVGLFSDVLTSTEINDILDNGLEGAAAGAATGILNTRSGYWGDL